MGAQAEAVTAPQKKQRSSRKKKKVEAKPRRRASDREVDALRNEVLGIAIAVACLAIFLALVSFVPADVAESGEAAATGRTHNLIGPVGASIANIVLAIFGLAAFLLPISLFIPGLCFLTGKELRIRLVDAVSYPILILCCAMAAHLWLDGRAVLGHGPGGWVGEHGAEILRSFFGTTGTYLLIYSALALTFVMSTGISLINLFSKIGGPIWRWLSDKLTRFSEYMRALPGRIRDDIAEVWSARHATRTAQDQVPAKNRGAQPKITDRRSALKAERAKSTAEASEGASGAELPKKKSFFNLRRSKKDVVKESGFDP